MPPQRNFEVIPNGAGQEPVGPVVDRESPSAREAAQAGRLERAEAAIEKLESPAFERELRLLRDRGETVARETRELHRVSKELRLNEWFIADGAVNANEIRQDAVSAYTENQGRFEETRQRLTAFFSLVRQFAERYGLSHLGGADLTGGPDFSELQLARDISAHFDSPDALLDAVEQARDAKLYCAYAEKREITGTM